MEGSGTHGKFGGKFPKATYRGREQVGSAVCSLQAKGYSSHSASGGSQSADAPSHRARVMPTKFTVMTVNVVSMTLSSQWMQHTVDFVSMTRLRLSETNLNTECNTPLHGVRHHTVVADE